MTTTTEQKVKISELKQILIHKYFPHRYIPIVSPVYKAARKQYRMYKYSGKRISCAICEQQFSSWIGQAIVCPGCGSAARHRRIWFFLDEQAKVLNKTLRVLHIAPWEGLQKKFKGLDNWEYITADLSSPYADIQVDLTNMDLDDGSFDMVICSHILEHIPNDLKAMSEIFRILTPGGHACILVPYSNSRKTIEDSSISDPLGRIRLFGQADHVRKYGSDLKERLESVRFSVSEEYYARGLNEEQREIYGVGKTVDDNDAIFWCSKS